VELSVVEDAGSTPTTKSWLCRLPIRHRYSKDLFVGVQVEVLW